MKWSLNFSKIAILETREELDFSNWNFRLRNLRKIKTSALKSKSFSRFRWHFEIFRSSFLLAVISMLTHPPNIQCTQGSRNNPNFFEYLTQKFKSGENYGAKVCLNSTWVVWVLLSLFVLIFVVFEIVFCWMEPHNKRIMSQLFIVWARFVRVYACVWSFFSMLAPFFAVAFKIHRCTIHKQTYPPSDQLVHIAIHYRWIDGKDLMGMG